MSAAPRAYYNEHDKFAAAWLRNLIAAGHIAPGDVDERDIRDVRPNDLAGYTQCHFFAGIGGWSYAARLAGWPDSRPLWTGSCPCQGESVAGKRLGKDDPRHLWPAWFPLIKARRPVVVMGEQVARAAGTHWLDGVCADMESVSYTTRAAIIPACAVDAPHRRDRLWFVADAERGDGDWRPDFAQRGEEGRVIDRWPGQDAGAAALADTDGRHGFWWSGPLQVGWNCVQGQATAGGDAARTQWRVKPGLPLLADGVPARVGKLCAFGNAIVPKLGAEIIGAYLDAETDQHFRLSGGIFA